MIQMSDIEQVRAYYTAILPYYEAALEDRGDLPFWRSIARRWSSRRILELGCGTGRVTSVIGEQAATTAVDLLIEMVHSASRRAREAHFVVADLRDFAFVSTFDLIVLADDPMAHLTSPQERIEVMKRIADHLAPEGRVVLEGLYRPAEEPLFVPPRNVLRDGEVTFTVDERWEPTGENAIWDATYRYGNGSEITKVTSRLRSWTREEVEHLPDAGLDVEALRGDFDERPFSDRSPRIVIVARKRGWPVRRTARLHHAFA